MKKLILPAVLALTLFFSGTSFSAVRHTSNPERSYHKPQVTRVAHQKPAYHKRIRKQAVHKPKMVIVHPPRHSAETVLAAATILGVGALIAAVVN
jgi:hypothetical protein